MVKRDGAAWMECFTAKLHRSTGTSRCTTKVLRYNNGETNIQSNGTGPADSSPALPPLSSKAPCITDQVLCTATSTALSLLHHTLICTGFLYGFEIPLCLGATAGGGLAGLEFCAG